MPARFAAEMDRKAFNLRKDEDGMQRSQVEGVVCEVDHQLTYTAFCTFCVTEVQCTSNDNHLYDSY